MKQRMTHLLIGVLVGATLFGGNVAHAAAEYLKAYHSGQTIYLDGRKVELEAYSINGSNYVKLRDIGEAVGFNVYWDGAVQIDSDAPYTGEAPKSGLSAEEDDSGAGLSNNPDGSINVPTDGSRYIPRAGDVVRCDDGTNYTITDVSRYDKSMFAKGSLPELPEATCDWSSFPEVALPAAEVRHFDLDAGDYMFIRNLYESRRMQYTIQNLAGNHPDTSENGKLKYGSKGTPSVRIQLTIPDSITAQNFWPWRDSELERLFNSCPPGTYYMEAWDVFSDGIFLYTQYKVYAL